MSDYSIRIRVAAVIIEDNKILLIAHKKNNQISWLLPGGGVNAGESLEEALKRELKEELNVSIDVKEIALITDSISIDMKRHIENICFFCAHTSDEYILQNEKILYDFNFFSVEELNNLLIFPPIKNELKQILNGSKINIYQGKKWIE